MKRTLCLLLVMVMLLLAACGGEDGGNTSTGLSGETVNSTEESSNESAVPDDSIIVPDISGMSAENAEKALKDAGFTVKVKKKPNDDVPEGEVIEIDLKAGDAYEKGTRVWLYVSTGKSLAGSSLEYKQSALVENRPVLEAGANSDYVPLNYEVMKACWMSQYDMSDIYSDGSMQRDEADFREKVANIFATLQNKGINTVIVQLRPNGDSFYPSAYYCPSKYVTGSYAIDFKYDPLAIMIEEAHKVGLSFHGWINPFRCMNTGDVDIINISYGVRKLAEESMGDAIIKNTDGLFWLNPASEDVRKLVVDGATEIVRYYDVDGIHMDDYFYPYNLTDNFDSVSFKKQTEFKSLDSYRFNAINTLVSSLYAGVKAENSKVIFGISPAGNPSVAGAVYVDYLTWLSNTGYVDYIMPQLYWGTRGNISFTKMFDRWESFITVPEIRLIPGMDLNNAAKGYAGEADSSEWNSSRTVLKNCMEYAISSGKCDGYSLFSLATIISPSSCEDCKPTTEELSNLFGLVNSMSNETIKY
ncbi:MAG: family 10 glycosylhydrolase [Clostridia bacterium]|nr:family 10 glycosylhydrolase [Clostridia bacterium]